MPARTRDARVTVTTANGDTRRALMLERRGELVLVRYGDHTRALVPARDVRPNTRESKERKGIDKTRH